MPLLFSLFSTSRARLLTAILFTVLISSYLVSSWILLLAPEFQRKQEKKLAISLLRKWIQGRFKKAWYRSIALGQWFSGEPGLSQDSWWLSTTAGGSRAGHGKFGHQQLPWHSQPQDYDLRKPYVVGESMGSVLPFSFSTLPHCTYILLNFFLNRIRVHVGKHLKLRPRRARCVE